MAVTVGEVITFFEGRAENLFKIINKIEKRLDDLAKKTWNLKVEMSSDILPTKEIIGQLYRIGDKISDFSKKINSVSDRAVSATKKVGNQIRDVATGTLENIGKQTTIITSSFIARSLTIASAAIFGSALYKKLSGAFAIGNLFSVVTSGVIGQVASASAFFMSQITRFSSAFSKIFSLSITNGNVLLQMLSRGSNILQLLTGTGLFIIIPTALFEISSLVRKIRGDSVGGLSVLEKMSSLITFFHDSISQTTKLVNQFFRIFATGIATYFIPVWGQLLAIPSIINSISGFASGTIRLLSLSILRRLGSGKATLALAIHDIKATATTLLPMINKGSAAIRNAQKNAKGFRILPMIVKFQEYMRGILTSIIRISVVVENAFGKAAGGSTAIKKSVDSTLKGIDSGIKRTTGELGKGFFGRQFDTKSLRKKSKDKYTKAGSATKIFKSKDTQEATKFNTEVQKAVSKMLDFDRVAKSGGKTIFAYSRTLQGAILNLGHFVQNISSFSKNLKNVENTVSRITHSLSRGFLEISKQFKFPKEFTNIFQKNIDNLFFTKGSAVNKNRIVAAYKPLRKELKRLAKEDIITGKDTGGQLVSMISAGMKNKSKEVAKGMTLLANLIASFFPISGKAKEGPLKNIETVGPAMAKMLSSGIKKGTDTVGVAMSKMIQEGIDDYNVHSPAKKGPLKRILQSGAMIPAMIGKGMTSGAPQLQKATSKMVNESIANFFPRSLPLIGPLVKIVKMGALIPYYIAKGMISGISNVLGAASRITQSIKQHLERPFQIKLLSERTGVSVEQLSSLDFALKTVGGSVSELELTFQRLNKIIATGGTEEERATMRRLGIDLNSIRNAADPAARLLQELTARLGDLDVGSTKYTKTLELLGQTASSKLVNISKNLKDLQTQSINFGNVFADPFASQAKELTEIINKINSLRDTIETKVLQEIVPSLVSAGNKILEIIGTNRAKIEAVFQIVIEGFNLLVAEVGEFIKLAIENPGKALDIFETTAKSIIEFILTTAENLYKSIKDDTITFLKQLGITIAKVTYEITKKVFSGIKTISIAEIPKIVTAMFNSTSDALANGAKKLFTIDTLTPAQRDYTNRIRKEIRKAESLEEIQKTIDTVREKITEFKAYKFETAFLDQLLSEAELASKIKDFQEKLKIVRIEIEEEMGDEQELANREKQIYNTLKGLKHQRALLIAGKTETNAAAPAENVEKDFNDIFNKIKPDLEKLSNIAGNIGGNIFDEEQTNEAKKNLKVLIDKLQETTKGTELEGALAQWQELLSQKNWDAVISRIAEFDTKMKKAVEPLYGLGIAGGGISGPKSRKKTAEEKKSEYDILIAEVRKKNEQAITGLGDIFTGVINKAASDGKLTMTDLAEIAGSAFKKSFDDVIGKLRKGFESMITDLFSRIGANSKIVSGAIEAAFAVGFIVMERIKSKTETTFNEIKDGVDEIQEKTRGLIVGDQNVAISSIMQNLTQANIPVVIRLDRLIEIGQSIEFAITGTGGTNTGILEYY